MCQSNVAEFLWMRIDSRRHTVCDLLAVAVRSLPRRPSILGWWSLASSEVGSDQPSGPICQARRAILLGTL